MKPGLPVLDILKSKHPPLQNLSTLGTTDGVLFEPYSKTPKLMPLSVTQDIVELAGAKLSGAAGPGGTDGEEIKTLLLLFSNFSQVLQEEFALLMNWLASMGGFVLRYGVPPCGTGQTTWGSTHWNW